MAASHIGAALVEVAEALAAAAALERVCELVRQIEGEARAHGCRICEDGAVTAPRSDTGNAVLDLVFQAGFDATAAELEARLGALLDAAGETDEQVGNRLRAAG
ncbi:hypothetical protein GL305_27360 [Nocardia seriolae]|nr:hypothetical protein [Nocardia seriolae]MTK33550.1 hypothetical protein [Nocardia seriolae]MTK50143.1 hypothetical protein [Nocardia seriolae]